jgi:hypothetical protein
VKAIQIWIAFAKDSMEKRKILENLPRKPLVEVNPIIDKDLSLVYLNQNSETVSPRSQQAVFNVFSKGNISKPMIYKTGETAGLTTGGDTLTRNYSPIKQ